MILIKNSKKWYTYNKSGQIKMYSELPDGVGKGLTKEYSWYICEKTVWEKVWRKNWKYVYRK